MLMLKPDETIQEFLERNKEEFSQAHWHKDFETGYSRLDRLIMNLISYRQLQELDRIEEEKCQK